jgi:hypothetical protein
VARSQSQASPARRAAWADLYDRAATSGLGPKLATTVVPFVLVVYLALRGGGYDAVVRSEVGVAVWWIVLLGALAGLLPLARTSRASIVVLSVTAGFVAWTALALIWTESSERTVIEIARVGTYAGVLALAVCVQGRDSLRRTVGAVATAIAFVGLLALLSRLHPSWFPENRTAEVLTEVKARLNYPLNYWNGLAYLIAMGVPLLLTIATESRRIFVQALATAVIPALCLASFYTISRGGAGALVIAVALLVAVYPNRLSMLPTLALSAVGSVILIAAATQRNALEDGLENGAASSQGQEMIALVLVVIAGVALLRAAAGLAARYELGPSWRPSRREGRAAMAAGTVVLVGAFLALGAPGKVADRWEEFKAPGGPEAGNTTGRFESARGNGRYQWWEAAVDAGESAPLTGIGPGTYEYWWAREGSLPNFVRDAHSLYLEVWGELGVVGLVLIAALVLGVTGYGVRRSFTASATLRPWFAAATAAAGAFVVGSAFDWAWELAVLPVVFLWLAAGMLQATQRGERNAPRGGWIARIGVAAAALGAVVAIGVPLAGSRAVRSSQEAVDGQNLAAAQSRADTAKGLLPWAATPPLQQALVLELQGDLDEAAAAAHEATREESTNWRTWWVLARIERARGDDDAANTAYGRAQELNPRSTLFAQ